MKLINILSITALISLGACALNEEEVEANNDNFPFRLVYDQAEGADLPDAEDYGIEIEFADWLGDLPDSEIVLTYTLEGSGDFTGVSVAEVVYTYEGELEGEDCEYEREATATESTITIPVDDDLGTVPEGIEVVIDFGLAGAGAADGGFTFEITDVTSSANVAFTAITAFEYEILEDDVAGAWIYEFTNEADYNGFRDVFGILSDDLAETDFSDLNAPEVVAEFEFEEMKFELELTETEDICEDGEIETENVTVEIEAEWDFEDGEFELEGELPNGDDFLATGTYSLEVDQLILEISNIVDDGGDSLYSGSFVITFDAD